MKDPHLLDDGQPEDDDNGQLRQVLDDPHFEAGKRHPKF